jgi:hypothetical protein
MNEKLEFFSSISYTVQDDSKSVHLWINVGDTVNILERSGKIA